MTTRVALPGVVERVKPSRVRPGVLRRVKTLLGGRVGVDLANEGEGAVKVSVPCNGADRRKRRGGKGSARSQQGLRAETEYRIPAGLRGHVHTSNAEDDEEEVEAKRTRCSSL